MSLCTQIKGCAKVAPFKLKIHGKSLRMFHGPRTSLLYIFKRLNIVHELDNDTALELKETNQYEVNKISARQMLSKQLFSISTNHRPPSTSEIITKANCFLSRFQCAQGVRVGYLATHSNFQWKAFFSSNYTGK